VCVCVYNYSVISHHCWCPHCMSHKLSEWNSFNNIINQFKNIKWWASSIFHVSSQLNIAHRFSFSPIESEYNDTRSADSILVDCIKQHNSSINAQSPHFPRLKYSWPWSHTGKDTVNQFNHRLNSDIGWCNRPLVYSPINVMEVVHNVQDDDSLAATTGPLIVTDNSSGYLTLSNTTSETWHAI